jgi:hypothetical protein
MTKGWIGRNLVRRTDIKPPFNVARSDAQHKNAAKFHGCDYVTRKVVFDFSQILYAANRFHCRDGFVMPRFFALELEESAMTEDGFPHAVAVALGAAFATALSLFTAFAFGGLPWP